MKKEQVLEIVNDIINQRLEQLIEEISTNEFLEMVCDKLHKEVGLDLENEDQVEEVREVISSRVVPLLVKVSEYVIGVDLPK